jgi:hypothetical protein
MLDSDQRRLTMKAATETKPPKSLDLTPEEARDYFESEVQRLLGISGEEFLRRIDAGAYDDVIDKPGHWQIGHLEMLSSVVR